MERNITAEYFEKVVKYCHVTDDMLISEMSKFENGANGNPEGVIPINGVKVV